MFRKEYRIKCTAPLKGAEQKKLKATICKCFNMTDDTIEGFLFQKQLTQSKVITYTNDIVKIYCSDGVAIVFEFKGKYYPTLFMVWQFPNIVPRLKLKDDVTSTTIETVTEYNIDDIRSKNYSHMLDLLPVDQIITLSIGSCSKTIAIGYLILSGNTINHYGSDEDNCLRVLHHHNDELFKSLISQIIPDVISKIEQELDVALEVNDNVLNYPGDTQFNIEKMDELLTLCSMKALKHLITKEMLPILASTFYKKFVMTFCSEGVELDIKKTSYKKLSTFLQLLDEQGIIKFNVGSNGIAEITQVIYSNRKFQNAQLDDDVNLNKNVDQNSLPVKEIFIVTSRLQPIFSEFLCRKGDEVTIPNIRRYVTEYVKKYQLQDSTNPSIVNTNDVLKRILSQRKDQSSITFKDLIDEITKLMHRTEISALNTTDNSKNVKKKINNIEMTVNNRSGNKKVTLVNNLEVYGIDPIKFSKECQHGVAASTTINEIPNAQNRQVQIQGSQVPFVYKLLTEQYKIPVKFIRGHENYLKKKKK